MTEKGFNEKTARFLKRKEPFFFLISFDKKSKITLSFQEASNQGIFFEIDEISNWTKDGHSPPLATNTIKVDPFPFSAYLDGFEKVMQELQIGNSFLVNLTFPSKIKAPVDLTETFFQAKANYKLLFKDRFVCFSPECFIKIEGGYIYTYPMKGTIDASLENAEDQLLNDPKEAQEHNTVVDLMRNDLSAIAKEVTVTKFRYVERITAASGDILQTSTEIRGKLPPGWEQDFGHLLLNMLPAGSISGAPKAKTVHIINQVENYNRGFYTGVFGIYDGNRINSAVAIRFIEKENGNFWYKSGGGITHKSNVKEEYVELIRKIYIPTF